MRRVSEYVGQSIVSADSGAKVGTVADVVVDAQAGRLVGVIVSGGVLTSEHVPAVRGRAGHGLAG